MKPIPDWAWYLLGAFIIVMVGAIIAYEIGWRGVI